MRLRLAVIAMAIVVACGTFVVAHRRARAEQTRVALLQAETTEAAAAPAAGGSDAPAAAGPTRAPAATPPSVEAPAAPAGAGVVQNRFVQIDPAPRAAGAGPAANVIVAPQTTYVPAQIHYGVPAGDDPELNELTSQDQQLEQEVQSLARQLADSDDDKQRAELKEKLASTLEKQFDTQQKLRQLEISRIEARVQKLRDLVRKRTDSRRKIIENRLEQLLNDADGLGWNSAKGSGFPFEFVPHGAPGMAPPLPLPSSPPRSPARS